MNNKKSRKIQLDDDCLEVYFFYDEQSNMFFEKYPDFYQTPRYTPHGRPWVNAIRVGCPYAEKDYDDCGSCRYMKREKTKDLIGICENEKMQRKNNT